MILGHEWSIVVAAILVEGVVVWFLWRLARAFTPFGRPRQATDDAVADRGRGGEGV